MENLAAGFIEVYGFVTAIKAADAAAKAADVRIVALDTTKPAAGDAAAVPLVVIIKLEGSVSAVKAAVEAGVEQANKCAGVITHHVIARPSDETEKLMKLSKIGREKLKK